MKRNMSFDESVTTDKALASWARNILLMVIGSMLMISSGLVEVLF